jgi:hypothetical protein
MRRTNSSHLNDGDRVDSKQLLAALTAFKRGDFSAQLPDDWTGIAGKVADTFNEVIRIKSAPDTRTGTHRARSWKGRQDQTKSLPRRGVRLMG